MAKNRKSPWEYEAYGRTLEVYDAADRLEKMKTFGITTLMEVIDWPGTQKAVRQRANARLNRLLKGKGEWLK
jgi:hypothetical protein